MAAFQRTRPAPRVKGGYRAFRPYVRADFNQQCAYCLMHEVLAGQTEGFEIDHFRPRKRFRHLISNFYNLYWSCRVCNNRKADRWPAEEEQAQGKAFTDFCQDDFETHYRELPDGCWEPLTPAASYTLDWLQLNRPQLMELRRIKAFLVSHGWSPGSPVPSISAE